MKKILTFVFLAAVLFSFTMVRNSDKKAENQVKATEFKSNSYVLETKYQALEIGDRNQWN